MDLKRSTVYRHLEGEIKVFGMEAFDLCCLLLVAAVSSVAFGGTALRPWFTFGIPIVGGAVLYFAKRGRPDGFLVHFLRHHINSRACSAGEEGKFEAKRRRKIYEKPRFQ